MKNFIIILMLIVGFNFTSCAQSGDKQTTAASENETENLKPIHFKEYDHITGKLHIKASAYVGNFIPQGVYESKSNYLFYILIYNHADHSQSKWYKITFNKSLELIKKEAIKKSEVPEL